MWVQLVFSTIVCLGIAAVTSRQSSQTSQAQLYQYIQDVETAMYAIGVIQAGNATQACNDPSLVSVLDDTGYDGQYAQQLICEAAVGIQIFPDLSLALSDLTDALSGLSLGNCPPINQQTLDGAGLDGSAIANASCVTANQSSITSSASSVATTELLSERLPLSSSIAVNITTRSGSIISTTGGLKDIAAAASETTTFSLSASGIVSKTNSTTFAVTGSGAATSLPSAIFSSLNTTSMILVATQSSAPCPEYRSSSAWDPPVDLQSSSSLSPTPSPGKNDSTGRSPSPISSQDQSTSTATEMQSVYVVTTTIYVTVWLR